MDQNFHLIEKYFKGELSGEELDLFHSKLQNDSAFEQEFRDMKLIREGAKASARMKALNVLQNVEANLTEKETTKINVSMRRLVSIAASLLVIATVSYFAISDRTGGTMTGEEVFTAYYEAYPNIVSGKVRGENMELNTLSARAYNAYDIKDFSISADLFSELLTKEKNAANYFYSGISNLESGNYEVAKANFNVVMNNYSQLREQSQWYLAMTLLKDGEEDEALASIASLSMSKSKSNFVKKANTVLAKLDASVELEGDPGHIENSQEVPTEGTAPGDGMVAESMRRYQYGTLRNINTSTQYPFFNDFPIDGLEAGDIVEYYLISRGNSKKKMAVVLDRVE